MFKYIQVRDAFMGQNLLLKAITFLSSFFSSAIENLKIMCYVCTAKKGNDFCKVLRKVEKK